MLSILMLNNRKILILNEIDNIAVCLVDLEVDEVIRQDGLNLTIQNPIPRGHKVATKAIVKNEGIIKYGERMGHATSDIKIGEHVHTHNVLGDRLSTEQVNMEQKN
jgi:SAF domain